MRSSSSLPFWSAFLALLGAVVKQQRPETPELTGPTPIPELTAVAVERLAFIGCSDREIAGRFLIDEAVVRIRFARELTVARALRCSTLRKAQFDLARDGNGPMLQWLGRNELGQMLNPTRPGEPEPDFEVKAG